MSRVPLHELRAEVDASGLSHLELARRLGWRRHDGDGADGQRVRRVLGLRKQDYSRGYGAQTRVSVNAATAAKIRGALNGHER